MNLLERINEQLQILNEAQINTADLKGNRWNDAYYAAKDEISVEDGRALYRVKLYTEHGNDAKNATNPNAVGNNVKYLKLDLGSQPVHSVVNKGWIRKNANTSNFSFARTPSEATLFKLPLSSANDPDREDLINALKSFKAKRTLNYNRVELEKVDTPNADLRTGSDEGGMLSKPEESVAFNQEQVIQWYLTSLMNTIKSKAPGESVWGDYPYQSKDASSEAKAFYNSYLKSPEARAGFLEQGSSPLWGNATLTVAAYLFAHGDSDTKLMIKAALLVNALKGYDGNNPCLSCVGDPFSLAINGNLKGFNNVQFANTIQLAYNVEHGLIKFRGSSKGDHNLSKAVVSFVVCPEKTFDEENYNNFKNYLMGSSNDLGEIKEFIDVDLTGVSLDAYDNMKARAMSVLTDNVRDEGNVYVRIGTEKTIRSMSWEDKNLYAFSSTIKEALYKLMGNTKTTLTFYTSREARSKDIIEISEVKNIKDAKIENLGEGTQVVLNLEKYSDEDRDIIEEMTLNTNTRILSSTVVSGEPEAKPEEGSGAPDNPWAEWDAEHEAGTWEEIPEEAPESGKGE